MPRQPSFVHPNLRISDLTRKPTAQEKLLSIRLPIALLDRLDSVCRTLHVRKSEVVVAMLNEGLARFQTLSRSSRASRLTGRRSRSS